MLKKNKEIKSIPYPIKTSTYHFLREINKERPPKLSILNQDKDSTYFSEEIQRNQDAKDNKINYIYGCSEDIEINIESKPMNLQSLTTNSLKADERSYKSLRKGIYNYFNINTNQNSMLPFSEKIKYIKNRYSQSKSKIAYVQNSSTNSNYSRQSKIQDNSKKLDNAFVKYTVASTTSEINSKIANELIFNDLIKDNIINDKSVNTTNPQNKSESNKLSSNSELHLLKEIPKGNFYVQSPSIISTNSKSENDFSSSCCNNFLEKYKILLYEKNYFKVIASFCNINDLFVIEKIFKKNTNYLNLLIIKNQIYTHILNDLLENDERVRFWREEAKIYFKLNRNNFSYHKLLEQQSKYEDLIAKDIKRTFKNSKHHLPYQMMSFNVLKAYSNSCQEIGYCQGMSFIVKILISVLNNEKVLLCRYLSGFFRK